MSTRYYPYNNIAFKVIYRMGIGKRLYCEFCCNFSADKTSLVMNGEYFKQLMRLLKAIENMKSTLSFPTSVAGTLKAFYLACRARFG